MNFSLGVKAEDKRLPSRVSPWLRGVSLKHDNNEIKLVFSPLVTHTCFLLQPGVRQRNGAARSGTSTRLLPLTINRLTNYRDPAEGLMGNVVCNYSSLTNQLVK